MGDKKYLIEPRFQKWPDPKNGPYALRVSIALINGRAEVVGVELWGAERRDFVSDVAALMPSFESKAGQRALLEAGQTPDDYKDETPFPTPEIPTAITSVAVRLPLREIMQKMFDDHLFISDLILNADAATSTTKNSVARGKERLDKARGRPGRKPIYGPSFFQDVANIYSSEAQRGGNPTSKVASIKRVHKSTAAKWVARARELGFLPPTQKGKVSANSILIKEDE